VQQNALEKTMSERNVLTAIIVLLLPLSFGLDPGPGRDMPENAGIGFLSGADVIPDHNQLRPLNDGGLRPSVISTDFAASATLPTVRSGVFESSLPTSINTTRDTGSCDGASNDNNDLEVSGKATDCFVSAAPATVGRSDVSFPLQSSFSESVATDENRSAGDVIPIGIGRQPVPDVPIPTPEPGSLWTLAFGVLALSGLAWKKSQLVCAAARLGKLQ
jgi:hypothetical protein